MKNTVVIVDLQAAFPLTWSDRVNLCTNGCFAWQGPRRQQIESRIRIFTDPVQALEGKSGALSRIRFTSGVDLACDALFFDSPCPQRSPLPERLGCSFDCDHSVVCSEDPRGTPRSI